MGGLIIALVYTIVCLIGAICGFIAVQQMTR